MNEWEIFTITITSDDMVDASEGDKALLTDRFESELYRLISKYNQNKVGLIFKAVTSADQDVVEH